MKLNRFVKWTGQILLTLVVVLIFGHEEVKDAQIAALVVVMSFADNEAFAVWTERHSCDVSDALILLNKVHLVSIDVSHTNVTSNWVNHVLVVQEKHGVLQKVVFTIFVDLGTGREGCTKGVYHLQLDPVGGGFLCHLF